VNIWQSCQQEGDFHALCAPGHACTTLIKDKQSARDNYVIACNFANYSPILIFYWQIQQSTFLNLVINNPTTP